MKQSFLNSLVGMTVKNAEAAVLAEGYTSWSLPEKTIITAIARPGVVELYHNANNIVTGAYAGDPLEVTS